MPDTAVDTVALQLELDAAWEAHRLEVARHERDVAELRSERVTGKLAAPKVKCFGKIAFDLQMWREGLLPSEEFLNRVDNAIRIANHEVQLVEEAQARARKAEGQL